MKKTSKKNIIDINKTIFTKKDKENNVDNDSDNDSDSESIISNDDIEDDIEDDEDEDDEKNEEDIDNETEEAHNKIEYDKDETEDIESVKDINCLYELDDIIEYDTEQPPTMVDNDDRITDNYMTTYEKVRIIGIRTKQIAMGAKVMIKYTGKPSALELAKLELENKMTPFIIKRPLPNNKYELWKISELNII